MAAFDAAEYKEQLAASASINACSKVPLPNLAGDQNYVFISYSHRDYKQVYCDLADLYEAGVPFWYDRGLPAGKNWDDVVREIMSDPRCGGVIFYLSENLFLSQSIQTEIKIVLGSNDRKDPLTRKLKYFAVNLTNLKPSAIMDKVYPVKEFTDTDDRMVAKGDWNKTLCEAFPDRPSYLHFEDCNHRLNLIEQINTCFNIVGTTNLYAFDNATSISGSGAIQFANGSRYEGQFLNSRFHGHGKITYVNGTVYEGEWIHGMRCGKGRATSPEGHIYEGEWKNGLMYKGRFTSESGHIYDGEWERNKFHGTGRFISANGDTYTGQWNANLMHGSGCFTWADGQVYDGEWEYNLQHGSGRMTYANGDVYSGTFVKGNPFGQGSYLRACDGHKYVGGWGENGSCGEGTYYYPDGASRSGIWDGVNLIQGHGVYRYDDGSWYDGGIRNNLRHGSGVYTHADGTVELGRFENDVYLGPDEE